MDGLIGYYNLSSWWADELSPADRARILSKYHPISVGGDRSTDESSLNKGKYLSVSQDVVAFLYVLAQWLQKDPDRPIAYKILDKAESLVWTGTPILDIHFLYQTKIETTYRDAHTPEGRDRCIEACRQQIVLAPKASQAFYDEYHDKHLVEHTGYRRLAMLQEHGGEYEACIRTCEEAMQMGWAGDWEKKIVRCKKRLQDLSK